MPTVVVVFGKMPIEDAATNALANFDNHLADLLMQVGLFSVSAIEPEHGILLFLHQVMGVTDVRSFVYSSSAFAGAVHGNVPLPQKYLDYFEMHGTEFALKATIPGDQADNVKDRIVSRMMQLRGYADYEQRAGYAGVYFQKEIRSAG